jgi:tetratricopeptide (TPR) repeat protein
VFEKTRNLKGLAFIHLSIARIYFSRANYDAAQENFLAALNFASAGNRQLLGQCYYGLSEVDMVWGNLESAESNLEHAMEEFIRTNVKIGQGNVLHRMGVLREFKGLPSSADLYEEALTLYRENNEVLGQANALQSIARQHSSRRQGIYDAIAICQAVGAGNSEAYSRTWLAMLLQSEGRLEEALQHLNATSQVTRRNGEIAHEAVSVIIRGIVLRRQAKEQWEETVRDGFALLMTRLSDREPQTEGFRNLQRYIMAKDPMTRQAAKERTREAWMRGRRHDLVRFWLELPLHPD